MGNRVGPAVVRFRVPAREGDHLRAFPRRPGKGQGGEAQVIAEEGDGSGSLARQKGRSIRYPG